MSEPAKAPPPEKQNAAVERITDRVARRIRKNLPSIIATLKEQLELSPSADNADKLKVAIELELQHEPSGALKFKVGVYWKSTRAFDDDDELGETYVPNQPELFGPTRGSADADAADDESQAEAGEDMANADGQKKRGGKGKRKGEG